MRPRTLLNPLEALPPAATARQLATSFSEPSSVPPFSFRRLEAMKKVEVAR
jgi:hypothetical protein